MTATRRQRRWLLLPLLWVGGKIRSLACLCVLNPPGAARGWYRCSRRVPHAPSARRLPALSPSQTARLLGVCSQMLNFLHVAGRCGVLDETKVEAFKVLTVCLCVEMSMERDAIAAAARVEARVERLWQDVITVERPV